MFNKFLFVLACVVASINATYNATTYIYKSLGDLKFELDVYLPPVAPPTNGYPIFFAIHGGQYLYGSKLTAFTDQELTEVMNRGWALVSIDYRLLPGAVLQDMLEDVQDAYQWVRTELVKTAPINTNLITIFGQSAGGGLATLGAYKLTPRPQAIIGFYSACTNWTESAFYRPEPPVDPLLAAAANKLGVPVVTEYTVTSFTDPKMVLWNAINAIGKIGWLMTTHDPNLSTEEVIANLKALSAAENVDGNYPPTYLAHGLIDQAVPYTQSVQLANKLQEFNIPHILDLVPDANHVFDNDPKLWQQHVLPAFDFAQKYMQENSIKFLEK